RITRREFCAPGIRQCVSEGALPGRLLYGPAEQSADGILSSRFAREGCTAPGSPVPADRRTGVRLALSSRGRWEHPDWADVCERSPEGSGAGDGGVWAEDAGATCLVSQVRL